MSNPPNPLAALAAAAHDLSAYPGYTARRLADGDVALAVCGLQELARRALELAAEVSSLEPHELPQRLPGLADEPRAGAAKLPDPGSNHSTAHLGRRRGASVDATPDTGFADEPLF